MPTGEQGQIEVRTQGGEQWVRTTDLGRVDADGFLFVDGRTDDVIIRGGFKVTPADIVTVLRSHPAVRDAGVTGMPDERLGAVPVGAVELAERRTSRRRENFWTSCGSASARYQVPAQLADRRRIATHTVAEGQPAGSARAVRKGAEVTPISEVPPRWSVSPTKCRRPVSSMFRCVSWRPGSSRAALADAGLSLRDVDGLCTCTGGTLMHSVELAEYLGITPRFTDATQTGGASYGLYVEHAAAAIAAGLGRDRGDRLRVHAPGRAQAR